MGSIALYVAPPREAIVGVVLQTTVIPATLLILIAVNRGNRLLLALTVGLLWAEALLTAALYTIGVSFAIVIPLIGIGIVQPYLSGTATKVVYVGAGVVATLSVTLFALEVQPNPLSQPGIAVVGFALLSAFALGLVWRAGDRWVEALDAADREIAARVEAERERERLEASLRQAHRMEAVGRLAGVVAHDLNNAMMAVGGFAELIAKDSRDPEAAANAKMILKAADRASLMTRQLLVSAGQSRLEPQVVDLVPFVDRFEGELAGLLGEAIQLEVQHAVPSAFVQVDPDLFADVIRSLTMRGRDAMPEGGTLTISTSREAGGQDDGATVVVAVTDTGAPLEPDVAERLFDPFLTTGIDPRTGLELAVAFGIVRQSDGEIVVRPGAGGGSTIEIRLPEVERPEAA
jgi:signal transduction histidine kinase